MRLQHAEVGPEERDRLASHHTTVTDTLQVALNLTDSIQAAYLQADPTERRLLNQAFFDYIEVDTEEITDHTLNPPFAQIAAANALLAQDDDPASAAQEPPEDPDSAPAGPTAGTPTRPQKSRTPAPSPKVGGSYVTVMVEPSGLEPLTSWVRSPISDIASEVGTPVAPTTVSQFDSARAPAPDVIRQLLVTGVVKLELVSPKPVEPGEHLGEHRRREPEVLLGCKPAEPPETEAPLQRHQIDEVTGLGPPEDGKHLVDRELLPAEQRRGSPRLRREQSRVRSQVDLRSIGLALDDQPGESDTDLNPLNAEACVLEREVRRLVQADDDLRDLQLKPAQHSLRDATVAANPVCPRPTHLARQHQLVPELEQLRGIDIEPHVIVGSLAQYLLVDAHPITSIGQVVRH